jgi:hypothetical protein
MELAALSRHDQQPFSRHQATMLCPKRFACYRAWSEGRRGAHGSGTRLEVDMTLRALVGGIALAAGSVACVHSAAAADLPPARMPPAVAPVAFAPPVYNWSGF